MKVAHARLLFLIGAITFARQSPFATAQILHAVGDRPSFEVATIRPWKRTPPLPSDGASAPVKVMKVAPAGGGGQPTNRVHLILPAALLIASAYNLPVGSENKRIKGPAWLRQDLDQYEIQAKIDDTLYAAMRKMTPAQQREQVALMEQSLLADRFKMKAHFETEEMPVYSLVVAKGGPKLNPSGDGEIGKLSAVGSEQGMKMTAIAVTLREFVDSPFLTGAAGRVVLDQTGLNGRYDFTLNWESPQAPDAPSLFTAIQEHLGLKLIPAKAPVEVIVVDHVETPSAN